MQDELVRIARPDIPTGYCTTRRSWMLPGDIIYQEPETNPLKPETKPAGDETPIPKKPSNRKKVKK